MKKPKLICKTPILKRCSYPGCDNWANRADDHFLCGGQLGNIFTIPAKCKRLQGFLYAANPGPMAQEIQIHQDGVLFKWRLAGDRKWLDLESEAMCLLRRALSATAPNTIRSAWLEIELD